MIDYYPDKYLTQELLQEVLDDIGFKTVFKIEDDLPDGLEVVFSGVSLYVSEYAEGEISIHFLAYEIGTEEDVPFIKALIIIKPNLDLSKEYKYHQHHPFSSKQKVLEQLFDYFTVVKKHMNECINGDLGWVSKLE